jgi:hypothetical protein
VLKAHNEKSQLFEEISYRAPLQARQTDVDFLLRKGKEYLALEVKTQSRFSSPRLDARTLCRWVFAVSRPIGPTSNSPSDCVKGKMSKLDIAARAD